MENKIAGAITPDNISHLEAITGIVTTEMPYLLSLTNDQRMKMRKMATKNTGYVADVYGGIQANLDVLPVSYNFNDFKMDFDLMSKLPYVKQIFRNILEQIEDTEMQLGHELMKHADIGYAHLKLAAKDSAPVKALVDEIGTAYLGVGKKNTATTYSIAPASKITVPKVVTKTSFVNNGKTVLKFKAGGELASKVKSLESITVEPGNSEIIAADWTIIEVTNESATTEGSFSVKIK